MRIDAHAVQPKPPRGTHLNNRALTHRNNSAAVIVVVVVVVVGASWLGCGRGLGLQGSGTPLLQGSGTPLHQTAVGVVVADDCLLSLSWSYCG